MWTVSKDRMVQKLRRTQFWIEAISLFKTCWRQAFIIFWLLQNQQQENISRRVS